MAAGIRGGFGQKEVNGLSPEGCTVFGYASSGVLRGNVSVGKEVREFTVGQETASPYAALNGRGVHTVGLLEKRSGGWFLPKGLGASLQFAIGGRVPLFSL